MCGVATGTHGRDNQTTLQKALAVDAFRVPFYNFLLGSCVSDRRFLALSMAPRAQNRNIGREGG